MNVAGLLDPRKYKLRFDSQLEAKYEAAVGPARNRAISAYLIVYLAAKLLLLFANLKVGSQVFRVSMELRLGIILPLTLLAVVLLRRDLPGWIHGLAAFTPVVLETALVMILGRLSRSAATERYVIAAGVGIFAQTLLMQAPFRYCARGLAAALAVFGTLCVVKWPGHFGAPISVDEMIFVVVLSLPALYERYSRERAGRREFVLSEANQLKTALLEAQTEATIDGILVVDESDRIIFTNKQYGRDFGVPEQLLSAGDYRAVRRLIAGKVEAPATYIERIDYLNSHHSEKSMDELRFKNGQIFDRHSAPLLDSDEQYRGRIWYFRDITERKRTEDVLRRLSSVVEQSPVTVVIADLQGDITYVNRKFTETSGYEADEVLGKNNRILKTGHSTLDDYRELWNTVTAGEEWRGVFHNRKKNGELYWESAMIRPLQDHDGTVSHYVALKEDITEKLALEGQLRQSHKLEAIGQLAAGIAHEINTPIQYVGDNVSFFKDSWKQVSCLLAAAQNLRSQLTPMAVSESTVESFDRCSRDADIEYLSQNIPQAIDQTLEGVERVSRIVRAMKEFSHPGSREKRAVDLNKAIENTITISSNEWKFVAKMETRLDRDLPLVPCLAGEINQVLLNLVVNSAHAIAEAAPRDASNLGTITVSTRRDGDEVELSVADTGSGIPDDIKERVFDPFFTTKEVGKGTGQGLNLAHTVIVKKHGGKIWFESQVGQGTTFYVRLPLSLAAED